jgi:hypothetical protein
MSGTGVDIGERRSAGAKRQRSVISRCALVSGPHDSSLG